MADAEGLPESTNDIASQLAEIKEQLTQLIENKAMPMLHDARDTVMDRAEELSEEVRARPLRALGIAAIIGFILGRLAR